MVNDEFRTIWKEVLVACAGTTGTNVKSHDGRRTDRDSKGVLTIKSSKRYRYTNLSNGNLFCYKNVE
jgi:hypothetical protein